MEQLEINFGRTVQMALGVANAVQSIGTVMRNVQNTAINVGSRVSGIFARQFNTNPAITSIGSLKSKLDDLYKSQSEAGDLKGLKAINRQIRDTERELNRLQNAGTGGNGVFGRLKSDMMSLPGAQLLTNPIIATTGALVTATNFAMDFDKGMAQVNATAQLSPEKLDGLKKKLIDLGKTSNVELGNMPQAFNTVLSAVGDVDKAMAIFEPTLKASQAGFTDVNVAADAITNVLGSAGLGADKAQYAYDVLFKVMKNGKAEFNQIAAYMPKVLPAAMQVGVGFEQAGAAFAFFTTKGQSVEQTTTLLQNAFKALSNPERVKDFQKMGVNIFDSQGKMRDLADIAGDLNGKLNGLTDQQKIAKLASLGLDQEAANAFALMSQDADGLRNMYKDTANANGELNNVLGFTANTADKVTAFMNSLKAVFLQIGSAVLPLLTGALNFVQPLITMLADTVSTYVTPLFSDLGGILGEVFAPVLSFVGYIISNVVAPALGTVGSVLKILKPLFSGLGWVLQNIVAPVLETIGDILGWVIDKIKWAADGLSEVLKFLGLISDTANDVSETASKTSELKGSGATEKALGDIATAQKDRFMALGGMFMDSSKSLTDTISNSKVGEFLGMGKKEQPAVMTDKGKAFDFGAGDKVKKAKVQKGLDSVAGGGSKQTHITINMDKFQDSTIINTTTLKEGTDEVKKQIAMAMLEMLNGVNQLSL